MSQNCSIVLLHIPYIKYEFYTYWIKYDYTLDNLGEIYMGLYPGFTLEGRHIQTKSVVFLIGNSVKHTDIRTDIS